MNQSMKPAAELEQFLNFVDNCIALHGYAYDQVGHEDNRLQDLLHEMEFAQDKAERNRVATKLQRSRKNRRENKDIVLRCEKVAKFFEEPENRKAMNRLRQLLGQQRKVEEYLEGKREYKPRVKE